MIFARKHVAERLSLAHEKQRDKRRKAIERSFGAPWAKHKDASSRCKTDHSST